MAGFCLEVWSRESMAGASALRAVDVGGSDTEQTFDWGGIRLAWSFRKESRHWWTREQDDRLLFIEGQPDRYPREGESLGDWLGGGRWGSYRGFEIRRSQPPPPPAEVTVFVDPLGTRPLFLKRNTENLLVSDKLSTIALYGNSAAEIHWPALLEAMALGSVYTPDTTLCGVEELHPGEVIEFHGMEERRRTRYALPVAGDFDSQRVQRDPAGTLLSAMKQAVADIWTDSQAALLLSGGLDSRLVLALGGPGRKAITVQIYESETEIARRLAACCQADLQVFPYLPGYAPQSARLAVPIGGAMHDPHFFNHLGIGARWRSAGVTAVTHAFLFDTLLKGCFLLPAGGLTRSLLARSMPRTARYFVQTPGRGSHVAAADVIGFLSPRGREALRARLSALDSSLGIETDGSLDVTYESLVLRRLTRQIHYGALLGWNEELDVSSPIFHPTLWSWHGYSRAADRYNGRAFIEMLLSLDHDVAKVADANTGALPRIPEGNWRDSIRHKPLYQRFLQPLWRKLVRASDDVSFSSGLGNHFREPDGLRFLTQWTREIGDCDWFDTATIESYLAKFSAGEDRYLEPLLVCASAARWRRIVRDKMLDEPG